MEKKTCQFEIHIRITFEWIGFFDAGFNNLFLATTAITYLKYLVKKLVFTFLVDLKQTTRKHIV